MVSFTHRLAADQHSCRSAYLLANNAVSTVICKTKRQTDKDLDSITVSRFKCQWIHSKLRNAFQKSGSYFTSRLSQVWSNMLTVLKSKLCPRFCYNCFLSRESGYAACTYKLTVVDTLAETLPSVRELSVGCSPCIVVAVAGNSR